MFAPVRPTLLIDVDGVLSLFGFDHVDPPDGFPVFIEGTPHWLSKSAGERLTRLAQRFDCVWCTGWEERAEDHLPHLLGLPGGWPHLRFDERRSRESSLGHWKLEAIDAHVARTNPLAWI